MSEKRKKYDELRCQLDAEMQVAQTMEHRQQRDFVEQQATSIVLHFRQKAINSLHYIKLIDRLTEFENGAYAGLINRLARAEPTPQEEYIADVRKRAIDTLLTQYKAPLLAQVVEMVPTIRTSKGYTGGDPEVIHQCITCGSELCCCGKCHMVDASEENPRCSSRMPEREKCHAWILAYRAVWAVLNKDKEHAELVERPWTQILLIPGDGKWASLLPGIVRNLPHTMLKQDGENWLLSMPPSRPLSEQDERRLNSLISQHILKSWQVLPSQET